MLASGWLSHFDVLMQDASAATHVGQKKKKKGKTHVANSTASPSAQLHSSAVNPNPPHPPPHHGPQAASLTGDAFSGNVSHLSSAGQQLQPAQQATSPHQPLASADAATDRAPVHSLQAGNPPLSSAAITQETPTLSAWSNQQASGQQHRPDASPVPASEVFLPGDCALADAKQYLQTGTRLSPAAVTAATTPAADVAPPALTLTGSHKSQTESAKHGARTSAAKPGKSARPASNAKRIQAGIVATSFDSPPAAERPSPVQFGAAKQAGAGPRRAPGSSLDSGLIKSTGQQGDDVHVPGNMPAGGNAGSLHNRAAQHPGLGLLRGSAAIKADHSTQMGSPDAVSHPDTSRVPRSPKLTGIAPRTVVPVKPHGHSTTSSGLQSSLAGRNSESPYLSMEGFAPQLRRGSKAPGSKAPPQQAALASASAALGFTAKTHQSGRQNLSMTNTFGLLEDHLASDEDQEDDSDDQTSYGLGFDLQASDAAAAAFLFQTGTASSARGWGVSAGPPASHLSTDAGIDEGLWQQVERKGTRKVKVPESKGTARAGALRNYRPPYTPAQSSVEQQWDVRPAHFSFGHQQLHLPRPAESRHNSHSQQQGFEPITSSLGSLGGNTLSSSRNRREGTQVQTFYQDQGAPSALSAIAQRGHLAGAQAQSSLLAANTDQPVLNSSQHSTVQLDAALKDLCWHLTEHASAAMELSPDTGMCFISSSGQALAACSFIVAVPSTTMTTALYNQHHMSPTITDNMSGHGAAISHLPHQPTSATFCARIPFSG